MQTEPERKPPLFQQIAQILRERLRDGTYPHGIPLPGERELAHEFKVARITVRSALTRLQEEGSVTRLRGQGTLPVERPSVSKHSKLRNGLLESIVSLGQRTRTSLESVSQPSAHGEIARLLQVPEGSRLMRLVRIRWARYTPLLCTEVYLPPQIAERIHPEQLEDMPVLVAIEKAGYAFANGEQELVAVNAPADVAHMLQIPEGSPLLRVSRVVTDDSGMPIQYLIGHYAPEHYHYRMRMSRTGGATQVWITD